MEPTLKAAVSDEILERLSNGEGLLQICKTDGMPDRRTVQRWQLTDAAFDAAITRAREVGMFTRAEQAVSDAKVAEDATKGRLAFDAERWYIGKLSNAFSDKIKHVGGDEGDKPIRTEHGIDLSKLSTEALRELSKLPLG